MKLHAFSARYLLVPLAALALVTVLPSRSVAAPASPSKTAPSKPAKAALVVPNVTLPYSFICPDCAMKITIKTPADWNKDCLTCACNKTNLGCYHDKKK